jgi:hypothetical protein
MTRLVSTLIWGALLVIVLPSCGVYDERRCPHGWVPEHRDWRGQWHSGHCR